MTFKMVSVLSIFAAVLLCDVTLANENSALCSVSLTLSDDGQPICSNECEAGVEPIWYDGVIYKRPSSLGDQMVAVKFTDGRITECLIVPYESDSDILAWQAEMQACLSENKDAGSTEPETPLVTSVVTCPAGFTMLDKQCYMVTPRTMSYTKSKTHCQSQAGELASIDSSEEQELIASVLPAIVYIGITDKTEEGVFIDVKKRDATYFNWRSGEPNNVNNEDCVLVRPNSGFKWWDIKCNRKEHALCEAEPLVVDYPLCAEGQLMFEGSCYFIPEESMTFDEGKMLCKSSGGYLAFVNGEEEQEFLAANVESSVLTGLNDINKEGLFIVPNYGIPFYTRWSEYSTNSDSLDCSILDSSEGFSWTYANCQQKHRVLCELPTYSAMR